MSKTVFTVTLIAMLGLFAAAQDSRTLPPVTMRENTQAVLAQPGTEAVKNKGSYYPPFCPPKTCLYYAGDFETSYSDADGVFDTDYVTDRGQLEGQAWVGVKPDRDVTVTGATFVEWIGGFTVINPSPFVVQVGIKPGQAGKTVCSTSGNGTLKVYQEFGGFGEDYSFTIEKLSKPCKLKKGRVYYVNLLPISDDGFGYVMDVPPQSPSNHHGWKNDLNDCYFNGAYFGVNYANCNGQDVCGSGCQAFSIALTGKETK